MSYRTGEDPLTEEQEKLMNEEQETVDKILNPETEQPSSIPPEPEEEAIEEVDNSAKEQQTNPLEDIETAVLLVVNSHGNVLPVVQIENLNMRRVATPREVYRICIDAADQLSSVSILGEMTQIYSTIAKEQGKLIAQNMASLLIQAQQAKAKNEQ